MTLRIPTAALTAGQALDRSDTPEELEAAWVENGCPAFRGLSGRYIRGIRDQVEARHARNADALRHARAS